MTEEKRRKVLVTVLAACVLGAGCVWVALHDSGGPDSGASAAFAPRKIRDTASKTRAERPGRDNRKGLVAQAGRKDRVFAERDPGGRMKRPVRRGKSRIEKKVTVPVL